MTSELTYQEEKALGVRRPNGALYLKKLNGKHMTCIGYHMAGMSGGEIATAMNLSQAWVSTILTDPLSIAYIKERAGELDMELRAMGPLALAAMRNALRSEDRVLALSASDKWLRANGHYDQKSKAGGPISAEDIVAEMLKQTESGETTSVQISVRKGTQRSGELTIDHEAA